MGVSNIAKSEVITQARQCWVAHLPVTCLYSTWAQPKREPCHIVLLQQHTIVRIHTAAAAYAALKVHQQALIKTKRGPRYTVLLRQHATVRCTCSCCCSERYTSKH